jgi:glycosyltransferase involved in cell wall biosynthesis
VIDVKVGLLAYGLDGPLSGIVRYTLELAHALDGQVDITPLVAGGLGPLAAENRHFHRSLPGCRLLPGLVTLGNAMVPLQARRLGLDVVHDPTGVTPFLFGAGGARSVVTVHDVFTWSCPGHSTLLDTLIYRHWLPRVLPGVDAVITVSQASRNDIIRFLGIPAPKVWVVYEGVSLRYRPSSQEEIAGIQSRYSLPHGYLLFVGSVERRKNLPRLLPAYARLRQGGETRPLVVAGVKRGGVDKIGALLQDLDLRPHVLFTGYIPEADLPALYRGADLFVFPSLYEGFGLPPLEAMACGTPVVCSNAASLPEVVGDAAITVDPYDVEGLAEAMRRVLGDAALREELREKGLARARQFTWERTARETVAVYRQVLNPQERQQS